MGDHVTLCDLSVPITNHKQKVLLRCFIFVNKSYTKTLIIQCKPSFRDKERGSGGSECCSFLLAGRTDMCVAREVCYITSWTHFFILLPTCTGKLNLWSLKPLSDLIIIFWPFVSLPRNSYWSVTCTATINILSSFIGSAGGLCWAFCHSNTILSLLVSFGGFNDSSKPLEVNRGNALWLTESLHGTEHQELKVTLNKEDTQRKCLF